jgi:molecular chaperone HscB
LELQGIDVTQVKQEELSPELLLEQIEFREELEELPRDDSAIDDLNSMRQKIEVKADEIQQRFAENHATKQLLEAKTNYYEMQYFFKLILEIDALEEDLLGY